MNTMRNGFRISVIAAALAATYGPAIAADDEMAAYTDPESWVSFSAGHWSADRPQLGIYDGMDERGAFGNIDFSVVRRDESNGTWLTASGSNLGLGTRELRGEYLRQGDFGLYVEHGRTLRNHPLTFSTRLLGEGTTTPTVTANAANPLYDLSLATKRDRTEVGGYKAITENLAVVTSYQEEIKDGNRQYGLGSQPFFLVEPVNSKTQQVKLALEYTLEKLQLSGGYLGSWYTNRNPLILATNSNVTAPGSSGNPSLVPLSQPLDNQAHQLFLDGGYSFTGTTRGSFKLSYSHATQNEHLPSYDLASPNDPLAAAAGINDAAPSRLGGEINTTIAQASVHSRPIPKLSVLASVRYQDVDDATPVALYVRTVSATTGAVTTVHNTPHSITTTSGKVEATYQLPMRFNLTGGVEMSKQDRSYPELESERYVPFRAKLDEDTYRLQLRRPLTDTVSGSIAYLRSERDGSDYLTTEHFASDLINPLHIADRERDKWRLMVNWEPSEALSLQGSFEDSKDDYGYTAARPYGLRDGTSQRVSLDGAYAISDEWKITAWVSHDETEANQYGASFDRLTDEYEYDRTYNLKDVGDSVGFGMRGEVTAAIRVGADLQWTKNRSDYNTSVTENGPGEALSPTGPEATAASVNAAPVPITSKVARLGLFAQYDISRSADVRLDLVHERWETDDWSYQFANGTAFSFGTGDGTTVTASAKQISNFAGVRYRYRFQ